MAPRVRRVHEEIRQSRPFPTVAQEAVVALLRTTDVVRRVLAGTLAPAGVTPQQYNVLRILRGAGPAGLATLDIAGRMLEQTPGITRLLDRLELKGLVSRERCPTDRRQVTCRITAAGLGLLARLDPVVDALDGLPGSVLTEAEQRTLVGLLDRLRAGMTPPPAG